MTSAKLRSRDRRRAPALALALVAPIVVAAALLGAAPTPADDPKAIQAPPGFLGVDGLNSTDSDFAEMAAADVGVYRAVFPFGVHKQGRGQPFNWAYADNIVGNTASNGIDLIPMLYGVPNWVSEDLNSTPLEGIARRAWREYLVEFVGRYGSSGSFWAENPYTPYRPLDTYQIWNEPNSITWWGPRPDPAEYATLLQRSAEAIHTVDPAARIMTAGIVARPTNSHAIPGVRYMQRLFAIDRAAESADVVAYHPFAPSVGGVKRQLELARRTLHRSKARGVPISITEIGWGTKGPRSHPLLKSVRGQDRALESTFAMIVHNRERLGIERALWFLWRERRDDLCLWCESSGLVRRNFEPKPLLDTFRRIATR